MPIGRPAAELPQLSQEEILRYSRHLIIPEVGVEGQRRLKDARVLMVGAGGLGSPIGLYLAAAGVGRLGIVEFDVVDVTNLQRQVLHGTKDVGRKKVESARDRIRDVNPHVEVVRARGVAHLGERPRDHRGSTTSSWTAPTTSRPATS